MERDGKWCGLIQREFLLGIKIHNTYNFMKSHIIAKKGITPKMRKILLDTNILDSLSHSSDLHLLSNKKIYVSLNSIAELNFGFRENQKIKKIDHFLEENGVQLLGDMILLNEEKKHYPLKVDIENFVRAQGGIIENKLFPSNSFQASLKKYYRVISYVYNEKIAEIKKHIRLVSAVPFLLIHHPAKWTVQLGGSGAGTYAG